MHNNFSPLAAALIIIITLVGCASKDPLYGFACSPHSPRNTCEKSGYDVNSRECRIEQDIIASCSKSFVLERIRREIDHPKVSSETSLNNNKLEYATKDVKPFIIGSIETGSSTRPIYFSGKSESEFINSASRLVFLVKNNLSNYDVSKKVYLRQIKDRTVTPDQSAVLKQIATLEKLASNLSKAADYGKPFLGIVKVQAGDDAESVANRIVRETAPNDVYLQKAAEMALAEYRTMSRVNTSAPQTPKSAEAAIELISSLQRQVSHDYRNEIRTETDQIVASRRAEEQKAASLRKARVEAAQKQQEAQRQNAEKSYACRINSALCQ